MKKDDKPVSINRRKAEELYKRQSLKPRSPLTEAETRDFINELEINKLELELQNDELRHAWAVAEVASNRYTELYDFAPTGYITLSREGKIIELNLPCSRLLGKERSHIKNVRFSHFLAPGSQPVFALFLEKVFSGKSKETCEVSLSMNENSSARIQLSGVITEQGENCFMTIVDITDRVKAEENLMVSNELLSLFMKHSPIYSFIKEVTSTESRVLKASDNYVDMIGIPGSEMIGKTMYELFPAEFAAKITADDWVVVSEEKTVQLQENFDGRHYTSIKYPIVQGNKRLLAGYTIDVTDLKQTEEALQKSEQAVRNKLRSILEPEGNFDTLELADAIDTTAIQSLMEEYHRLTNIGIGILDLNGKVLVGVGWQDICTKFHRIHPATLENCIESDVELSANVPAGTFKAYRCKNNLWDLMTPIMVGGKHMGNVCLGQFFFQDEVPDYELFRRQAQKYGFDETDYLAALDRVPKFSKDVVEATMAFYAKLAGMIATLSYSTVKLSHALHQQEVAIDQLAESEHHLKNAREMLEHRVEERTRELAKSKTLLEETGMLARVGGWELDVETREVHWTDMVYNIHEIGKDFEPNLESGINFYAPESVPLISEAVRAAIEEGKPFDLELRLITAKNNNLWVKSIGQAIWKNGKIDRIGGVFQDITEKKNTELELTKYREHLEDLVQERNRELSAQYSRLQVSELYFRKIFKDGSIAMALVDATFHFTQANKAFVAFLGYPEAELVKLTFADISDPGHVARDVEMVKMLMKGEIPVYKTEKRYLTKNKEWVWGIVQVCILTSSKGDFVSFLVMIDNITDRKVAEDALLKMNETLEEHVRERTRELEAINNELSFKNKELEQFTYIASHDLQEPLLTLCNFTRLIREGYAGKLDDDGNKSIEFISGAAKRMSSLVKGLLDYSLLGKNGEKAMVDCNELVGGVLAGMKGSIDENQAKIRVQELPGVYCHEAELTMLFRNIFDNALKFHRKDIHPEIKISAESREQEWCFAIADNGIGIEEKDREKIFVIYKRMHNRNEYEGTGIGLALCKKIVELHGGKIWVESHEGIGSIFKFTIPKNKQA